MAISDFYLDTELQDSDFENIANIIIDSPYTWEEIRKIDQFEVFPLLQPNLLRVAGEWAGFHEAWLVNAIQASLAKRNSLKDIGIQVSYRMFKWMCAPYWRKLKLLYDEGVKS